MIVGNMIGGRPSSPKTCTFFTNSGEELQAILVDAETVFTAETNDVRKGKTFGSDFGVLTGTADIFDYKYIYANIDSNTGVCLGLVASTTELKDENFVTIPVNDEEYYGKYYIGGQWYEDASGNTPWASSLV